MSKMVDYHGPEVYRETIPQLSLGAMKASNNTYYLAVTRYICIAFEIGFIVFIIWNFRGGAPSSGVVLNIIMLSVVIVCLIIGSEWIIKDDIRGATPLIIFKEGIKVKRFPLEKLLGARTCIHASEIKDVKVIRGSVVQGGKWGSGSLGTWHDAPIELIFLLGNGHKYRSGTKLPTEVLRIADLIRQNWSMPVKDDDQGIGRFEPNRKRLI